MLLHLVDGSCHRAWQSPPDKREEVVGRGEGVSVGGGGGVRRRGTIRGKVEEEEKG